jgi:L-alanine-DL-glutamate epimerase-like enolase superfamily enzyme
LHGRLGDRDRDRGRGRSRVTASGAVVERLDVSAFTVPTQEPFESDGTATWDSTTLVLVEAVAAGGAGTGLGFTYGSAAAGVVIRDRLAGVVTGSDAFDVPGAWSRMVRAVRNDGRDGICSMAVSAVDLALWDLKARLLDVPLFGLLGAARDRVPVYGSGGFTSYDDRKLEEQLAGWVHGADIPRVKIKVGEAWGSRPARDLARARLARAVIGDGAELFVDANGGYSRKQAVRMGRAFAGEAGTTWFEEPVSSDDLDGLREVRDMVEPDVAAGEYGYDLAYFERMCAAGAVDCLQVDVTRCGGITDFLRAAAVAASHNLEVSGHCGPSMHAHVGACVQNLRHVEYFADHARVERLLFDGVLAPDGGSLRPDPGRPGNGLELRQSDAERYRTL